MEWKKISGVFDRSGNEYKFDGNAHTRESRVIKVAPEGRVTLFAGGTWGHADGRGREARFRSPGVMKMGADNCIYATEGGTVRRISLDGVVTTLAGPQQGFEDRDKDQPRASSLLGISLDVGGNVYAADWERHQVIRISPDGTISTILEWKSHHSGNRKLRGSYGHIFLEGCGTSATVVVAHGICSDRSGGNSAWLELAELRQRVPGCRTDKFLRDKKLRLIVECCTRRHQRARGGDDRHRYCVRARRENACQGRKRFTFTTQTTMATTGRERTVRAIPAFKVQW